MKILVVAVALFAVCINASFTCPKSLCKLRPLGATFRLSAQQPDYFVTCTDIGPVCRKCHSNLTFNNKLKGCLQDFKKPTTRTTATRCDDSLCKLKRNGALFRLDNKRPQYYVQCSNGFASCRQCPGRQYFNNKFQVCVRRTVPVDW